MNPYFSNEAQIKLSSFLKEIDVCHNTLMSVRSTAFILSTFKCGEYNMKEKIMTEKRPCIHPL
jgi:hypothetical protein